MQTKEESARLPVALALGLAVAACADLQGDEPAVTVDDDSVVREEVEETDQALTLNFCATQNDDYYALGSTPSQWSGSAICLNHYYDHATYTYSGTKVVFTQFTGACSDNFVRVKVTRQYPNGWKSLGTFTAYASYSGFACVAKLDLGIHPDVPDWPNLKIGLSVAPNPPTTKAIITSKLSPWS